LIKFDITKQSVSLAGREIELETGLIARQAGGSIMLTSGETKILATVCSASKPADDIDFLPLRVDYTERFSSAGKTLGGFIKREGKPAEREILVSRLIDRPIRPMIEEGYYQEVQILASVYSYDGVHNPEPLAVCAASAALAISEVPLIKPIGAVQVGLIDDRFIINPTIQEMKKSKLDLMIAGTEDAILMIEGRCDFLTEEQLLEAIDEGHKAIKTFCEAVALLQEKCGKPKDRAHLKVLKHELVQEVEKLIKQPLETAIRISSKQEREDAISALSTQVLETFVSEEKGHSKVDVALAFEKVQASAMRHMILTENRRCDGRRCDEIRPIDVRQGILPRTHGSTLFTRGETQSLAVCTLGGETMAQRGEDLNGELSSRFYLQYSFPPFSVGEVGRNGPPGRREVGHGKLAERALLATLPSQEKFPYVIRVESNITESNGSSSMASVCGGCLAMMEAGVPIAHPVAGIAMGLILEKDKHAILSDILGAEDALGDMDFKVAGNRDGITAFQLDIKVEGITPKIMKQALLQAKEGRIHILGKMLEVCPKSKETLSAHAPRIETVQVKPSKIGVIIGPGGKQIRAIIEESGAQIDINDAGVVSIAATSSESMEKAKSMILGLVTEVEKGKTYSGKVVSIVAFGAFVELPGGKQGLLHISEIEHRRLKTVDEVLKLHDTIEVLVLDVNEQGQIKLSRKALIEKPQDQNPVA
jgi:polyribonucleotide nucleotidyltransferase